MLKMSKTVPINEVLKEYSALREESSRIKKRMDALSATIKDYAEKSGTKNDSGSFYAENDEFIFGKQAKKSVSFMEETAIKFFKDKGLHECVKTIEKIDESKVEEAIQSGDLSYDELQSITQTKTTYAVDVKRKAEMPEVAQSEVKMAASRKSKPSLKGGKK